MQLRGANQISNTGSLALGGGTLDLNTYSAAVSSLSGSGTIDTVAGGAPTLTVGINGLSSTFGGTIQNSAGALALLKTGSGTLDLSGATTYTGATTIGNGALVLDHRAGNSGSFGATAVSVSGGAALVVKGNTSIAQGGSLIVAGGASTATQGVIDLRDGTVNTFTVNGNLGLGNASGGSVLDFEIGGSGVDQISAASVALSGTSTINLSSLGSFPSGSSYPLITVGGGTLNARQFQLGVEPGGFATFGLSTAVNNTELVLNITANPTPGTAYWTGKGSNLTSDSLNYWGSGGTSGSSNWGQSADGSNDPLQVPGATTNVIFTATNVASSGPLTTTLDHNYVIQGLTFNVPASTAIAGVTVNTAANSLAIGSGGLTLNALSSSGGTIGGAGGVIVNGSQSWANNSNSLNLTVSTPITATPGATTLTLNGTGTGGVTLSGGIADGNGGPLALSFGQSGATLLSGSNTYSGGTTLSAGILQLGGPVALPAGQALTVNGGVLDLNGFSQSLGALNGSAGTIQSSSAAATLTTGAGGASSAFYGTIQNGSGSVALTIGGGTLALYGNNTYTGGTSLAAGELAIGGSGALGGGTLTLGGGTLATAGGSSQTLGNAIVTTSAAQTFDTTNGNLTFTGALSAVSGGTAQALYSKYGPGNLTFLNSTGTLGGGLAVYSGTINFDGANVTDPYDTLRWENTTGTTAIVITGSANLQLGANDKNINSKMGQTAATKANPAWQLLTLNSGTLNFANSTQFHQLFVGDTDYNTSTVNQYGGLLSFATTSNTDGVELAVTANATGTYNLAGGILLTPAVTSGLGTSAFYFGSGTLQAGGGTLQANVSNANFFPNNTATQAFINPGGAFINDGGFSITIGQNLQGSGGLTKSGSGTLTLSGSNSYTGGTTISQGTLAINADSGLGAGGLSIGPATFLVQGNINSSRSIILADPAATIQVAQSFAYNNSGTISGSGALTVNGAGLLVLDGSNTYSGGTTLAAGTLAVGNAGALGSGVLTITGGVLDAAAPLTLSALPQDWNGDFAFGGSNRLNAGIGVVTLGGNRTVTVNGPSALTIGGPIGDNGAGYGLTKAGAGTLVLAGSNTYSGSTTVNGGALVVDQSGNNSGALGGTAVSVNNGAALVVCGNSSIAPGGSLTVAGGVSPGTIDLRDGTFNTFTVNGYLFLQGNANGGSILDFDLGNGSADQIAATGAPTVTGASNTINLNPIGVVGSGSYPLITAASGLSTSNFILGSKPAGFYKFSLTTPSSSSLVLSITGAKDPYAAYWTGNASQLSITDTANSWGTGYNNNTVSNWSTDSTGATDTQQVPGAITDVFFTAVNVTGSPSGVLATTLDAPYSIKSLTFGVSTGTIASVTVNTGTNSLTIGTGGLTLNAASLASATISGSGAVVLNGSQSWSNNSSQGLTVNAPVTAFSGATTLTTQGTGTAGMTFGGTLADGRGQLALNVSSGLTVLLGSNTYSGGTAINGGTLQVGDGASYGGGTTISGGVLEVGNGGSGASFGSAGGLPDNGSLVFNHADSVAFSAVISGNGSVTQTGAGTLTLLGNNTYTGGTTINGGTLAVSADSNLGDPSGTLSIGQGTLAVQASISSARNINLTGPAATIQIAPSLTYSNSGTISGVGGLTETGGGLLVLTGGNTYTGPTTIAGGTLQVGSGGSGASIGSSSNVLDNGSLVLNLSDTTSVSSISGSGSLTKTGSGVLTLLGVNSYTGTTTINAGAIDVGQASGPLPNAYSNVLFNGAGKGAAGVLQASGTLNLTTGTGPGQVQWTHNSGGFAARGGTLTVTLDKGATETWGIAPFDVSGGLVFGSPTADSPVIFTNNINLNSGNRNIYVNPGLGGDYALISGNLLVISSTDTTSQIGMGGNGLLILTGANSYPGATTISGGTLQIGNGGNTGNLGSGAISNSGALVFDRSDNGLVVSNAISGSGSVTQIGAGTLTLSGSNTYSGGTTVNAGVLKTVAVSALSPSSAVTVSGGVLDVTAFAQTIPSLSVGSSGTLNLGVGSPLTVANAILNGTLNVTGAVSGGSADLINYASSSGSFATANIPAGYALQYNAQQLDLIQSGNTSGPIAWLAAVSGSWNDTTKWSGVPPKGPGQGAVLNAATTSPLTVTLDSPQTVGTLLLGNSASGTTGYTLAAGTSGTLTLDNNGSAAQITVTSGSHAISAPAILADGLVVAPSSGATLAIDGNISQTAASALTLSGSGTLILSGSNSYTGGTDVAAGTLILTSDTALPGGTSLTVGAGGTFIYDPSQANAAPISGAYESAAVVATVPEPGTLALLAAAAAFLLIVAARSARRSVRSVARTALLTLALLACTRAALRAAEPINLALNKPASSSSIENDEHSAAQANDGDAETCWTADDEPENGPEWWQVDLQKPFDLSGCRIRWPFEGKHYQYKVEGSTDLKAWFVLSDQTNTTTTSAVHDLKFQKARQVRYVKITVTGIDEGCWASICEVKVFGFQNLTGVPR